MELLNKSAFEAILSHLDRRSMKALALVSMHVAQFVREYRYCNYYWQVGTQHCSKLICRFSVRWTEASWDRTCVPESARGIKVSLRMDSEYLSRFFNMESLTSDSRVESLFAPVFIPEMTYGNIRKISVAKSRFDSICIGAECVLEELVFHGGRFLSEIHVADGNRALSKIVIDVPVSPDWLQCDGRNALRSVVIKVY